MTPTSTVKPAEGRRLVDEPGVRLGIGGATIFLATAVLVPASLPAGWDVAALIAATAVLSAPLPTAHALALGLSGWAFADGFAIHRYGDLGFSGRELLLLAGFLAVASLSAIPAQRKWPDVV